MSASTITTPTQAQQPQPPLSLPGRYRQKVSQIDNATLVNTSSLPSLPLFTKAISHAKNHPNKSAIIDRTRNESFTFAQLLYNVSSLKSRILKQININANDGEEPRVAFLAPSGYDYVVTQWAIWAAGMICVPLCTTHPVKELLYTLSDSDPALIILHPAFQKLQDALQQGRPSTPIMNVKPFEKQTSVPELPQISSSIPLSRRALMIYTSGTTSRPKGCITTHQNITTQAQSLVEAWKYSSSDHLIHVLPLHHVHGIINGLTATLMAGGTVEMHSKFDPETIWSRWSEKGSSTMFMAVPTVYARLIDHFDSKIRNTPAEGAARDGAQALRLVISGSAALPTPIKQKFKELSGQDLLERYGMTEVGMALSCGLEPNQRVDGSVGWPLPGVQIRLVDATTGKVIEGADKEGEIQVKGNNVFKEYWRLPEVTKKEFTDDGWFKTGDVAKRDTTGAYFIQGRASVDVIKSGGYKISALEVERKILAMDGIAEVVVVGVDDAEWGQRVAAVVKMKSGVPSLTLKQLRDQLKSEMAPYKIPTILKLVDNIDRNAMGKVNKKDVVKRYFSLTKL